MLKRLFALTVTLATLAALPAPVRAAAQAQSAQALFNDASAKEKAVRKALADPAAKPTLIRAVRSAIASYEGVVRNYPSSGFCDDALWLGAKLSLDAYQRFGQIEQRDTATRMLRLLVTGYPASGFIKQANSALAEVKTAPAPAVVLTAAATTEPLPATLAPFPPVSGAHATSTTSGGIVTIKDIRRTVMPDVIRVTIELDGEVPFHDERIQNPARVFVDLSSTRPTATLTDRTIRFDGDNDLVRQVRVGARPGNTTRVVLDDVSGVSSYSVYPLYSPYRLVIDCLRATPLTAISSPSSAPAAGPVAPPTIAAPVTSLAAAVAPPLPHRIVASGPPASAPTVARASIDVPRSTIVEPKVPEVKPIEPKAIEAAVASLPAVPAAPAPTLPAKNMAGGFSMARQLGLSVSRIVIDPGHGGHDPGAKAQGSTEAELVLDVALKLEKLLQKVPGVEVVLTRRTDEFIPLQERTAIANRENADLFLSIHANASSNRQARGIETYFLSFATNQSAETVAARENAGSGKFMADLDGFVKTIALNNKLDESRDLASIVQESMLDKLRMSNKNLRDLGVKQAPFVVLIGAGMPSVLAEISFITHKDEAKLLKTSAYRQRIADALFSAIRKYQTSLRSTSTAAARP